MRGSNNGHSKKPSGRSASRSVSLADISHSGSWCFTCNRWKNLTEDCGCQPLNLGLSQEDWYRHQWSSFYQSFYQSSQCYNNQVPMFRFPPPNPAVSQQTASATIEGEAGHITEPRCEQVLPTSDTPPPSTAPSTAIAQGPDLVQTCDSTLESVPLPILSNTRRESGSVQRRKSRWDVQSVGEQDKAKEEMGGKKNCETDGLEEQVSLDVYAVDSDLATALAGLQKEEAREKKLVARRWRCLETEQNQPDSDTTLCQLPLPDLAAVYAPLHKEEKRKRRQSESCGDDAALPAAPITSSPVAVDQTLVRCDYCPLPGLVRREELNDHLKESHSQLLFSCSFCTISFPHYYEAHHHVKSKHDGRGSVVRPADHLLVTHKCLRCGARLTSREDFAEVEDHVKKAHNGWATVRWECRLCGESFPGKPEFEEHLVGRHAATLARTTTDQVQKVPFVQFWKGEVEKRKNKLMSEEMRRRKILKFKMTSSDSSSSSSEEEDQQGVGKEKSNLEKFVIKKTKKYIELHESQQVKGGLEVCHPNHVNGKVEESSLRLMKYKTLSWACAFVATSEKEESRELSRRKVAPVGEIHPRDFFQSRKKRKEMPKVEEDKSSGECSSSETEGSSHDSDGGSMKNQLDEEKLLALQTKLEKALKHRRELTKRDQRRIKKVEKYDAFFTDGFGIEATTEVNSEMGDFATKGREDMEEVQESNVEESVIERNNNIVDKKSMGFEQLLLSEQDKGRGEIVMDGKEESRARGKHGKKRKLSKISPLRALFPNRFKMGWKRVHS